MALSKPDKIYELTAEASRLIYDLGLDGWATEWELENKKTKEKVLVKVRFDIKRLKPKKK